MQNHITALVFTDLKRLIVGALSLKGETIGSERVNIRSPTLKE